MTKTELELIPDPDIYIFFEKGARGGISHISSWYRKANNKDLTTCVPPKNKKSKHICLDANNLYGYYAMSEFLPTTRFKWIYLKKFDLEKYTSNSSIGCVLEFDTRITQWLSFSSRYNKNQKRNAVEYQLKIADLCNIPISKVKKLVPKFFDKEN